MANNGDFVVNLAATLNTNDVEKQIKELNLKLKNTNTVNLKVNGQEAIKQVRTLTDEFGNLYKASQTWSKESGTLLSQGFSNITSSVKTLSTETNKWVDKSGALNTWTTTIDNLGTKITTRVKEIDNGLGSVTKTTETWGRTAEGTWGKLGNTITEVTNDQTKMAKATEEDASAKEKDTEATQNLTKQTQNLSNSTKKAATQQKSFAASMVETIGKVAKFYVATIPIQLVMEAFQSATEAVKDYDDAITELKKVTDLSDDSLNDYAETLSEFGESVARTTTEMVEASTEFAKSGYNEGESAELAQIASLYQNIADEELSAADASSVIISQMKAFGYETTAEATHVIDAINEVSNNFAVSSSDIGKGLTAAGAALSTYGNSYEQTIALVTAGTTIMQGRQ